MVASLGSRKWTVLTRDARQVVDQGVGRDLDACQRVIKEPTQRKLSPDWSALGIWRRDNDCLVPGSLEVIDGEHQLTSLRVGNLASPPRALSRNSGVECHDLRAGLAQIGAGDFADHPDPWFDQIVFDK
jgi:hypothetical protein